jgi:hypothetical protein
MSQKVKRKVKVKARTLGQRSQTKAMGQEILLGEHGFGFSTKIITMQSHT